MQHLKQQKKLICIGDSNTYGFDPRGYWGGVYDQPWPELIAENTGWIVRNLGENGRQIPSGTAIAILDRQIQSELPADIITVMLGGNDISCHWPHSAGLAAQRMQAYIAHLKTLITGYPGCKILLIAPAAVDVPDQRIMDAHCALGGLYREIASTNCCEFIDAALWNIPLSYDGIHYTEEGHRIFAEKLICEINRTVFPCH